MNGCNLFWWYHSNANWFTLYFNAREFLYGSSKFFSQVPVLHFVLNSKVTVYWNHTAAASVTSESSDHVACDLQWTGAIAHTSHSLHCIALRCVLNWQKHATTKARTSSQLSATALVLSITIRNASTISLSSHGQQHGLYEIRCVSLCSVRENVCSKKT